MTSHKLVNEIVQTHQRSQLIDVTQRVQRLVEKASIRDGLAVIFVPHTTAAVTINENADPDVQHDLLRKLQEMVPQREDYYRHSEGNSDSHLKTSLTGNSLTVLIEGGRLVLGRWQGIYFAEFDGPRRRELMVKLVDFGGQ